MSHSFWNRLVAAVLLTCCCAGTAQVRADEPHSIELDEIKSRLTEWRSSFVNLRVVWESRSLPETDAEVVQWPPPPDADAGSLFGRTEWIWADHGLDLLEEQNFFHADGTPKVHSIEVFNGPKGVVWRAQMKRPSQGPEEFTDLQLLGLGVGKPVSAKERSPVKRLYWPAHAAWLPEILSRWDWKVEEIETVGAEPCARVVATRDDVRNREVVEMLWLDLNHACLVRRHRSPAIPGLWSGGDFIVDEFQQLEGGIWFPKRGRTQLGGKPHENHLFVVIEAVANQSLDPARFEPPTPPVGTPVNDRGKMYRYGVPAGQRPAGTIGNAHSAPPPAGSSGPPSRVYAVPPRPSWIGWSAGLTAASVILLAVGFWLSRRTSEDHS